MKTIKAWCIKLNQYGYAGVFYFSREQPADHIDGMRAAIFRTRKQAREALVGIKKSGSWPKARVVRVEITIRDVS